MSEWRLHQLASAHVWQPMCSCSRIPEWLQGWSRRSTPSNCPSPRQQTPRAYTASSPPALEAWQTTLTSWRSRWIRVVRQHYHTSTSNSVLKSHTNYKACLSREHLMKLEQQFVPDVGSTEMPKKTIAFICCSCSCQYMELTNAGWKWDLLRQVAKCLPKTLPCFKF